MGTGHGGGGFVSSDFPEVLWFSKSQKRGNIQVLEYCDNYPSVSI